MEYRVSFGSTQSLPLQNNAIYCNNLLLGATCSTSGLQISPKTIAEIHKMKIGNINQRINDNRKRFKDGIDIIDLNTANVFKDFIQENKLLTRNRC